jgi:hypothetical protein
MEIELGPFCKLEHIKYNAYWSRVHIDSRLKIDEKDIIDYKEHLKDCQKNPTIGLLAGKKYITGKPMNYPEYANRNIRYLERQPEIDELKKSLKKKINDLYPKTKHIREYIISSKRVVFSTIEKSKKYTAFDKLIILLKKFI